MSTKDEFIAKIVPVSFTISRDRFNQLQQKLTSSEYITHKEAFQLLEMIRCENKAVYERLSELEWARPLRIPDKTNSLYIDGYDSTKYHKLYPVYAHLNSLKLLVVRTISKQVRNHILNKVPHIVQSTDEYFILELHEQNVVSIMDAIANFKFEIDPEVSEYYTTIKSFTDITNNYHIDNNPALYKLVESEIGMTPTPLHITDRRIKYQYIADDVVENTISDIIANRVSPVTWISTETPLDSIIKSLIELKRFPLMVYFDKNAQYEQLINLTSALAANGIVDNIGVYFRTATNVNGGKFNDLVHRNCYNKQLDTNTVVAAVNCKKFPKFLLTHNWSPKSILSFENISSRKGYTYGYTKNCDLMIAYTSTNNLSMSIREGVKNSIPGKI